MKKWTYYVILMIVCIFAGILVFFIASRQEQVPEPQSQNSSMFNHSTANVPSSQETSETIATPSTIPAFTVKEYYGHIGIFKKDETTPYHEIDVEVDSLPEADQELLRKGIEVDSQEKLNSIIEDYES